MFQLSSNTFPTYRTSVMSTLDRQRSEISIILKIKALCSSETSVTYYLMTRYKKQKKKLSTIISFYAIPGSLLSFHCQVEHCIT